MMKHGRGEVAHLTEDTEAKEINMCMAVFTTDEEWFLDLGATLHIIGNKKLVVELESSSTPSVRLVGDQVMHVLGQ